MKADEIREAFNHAAKFVWQWHEVPSGRFVLADENLAGPDGMHFTLFKEESHTAKDIEDCKRKLRRERDVVDITVLHVPPKKPLKLKGGINWEMRN